MERTFAASEPGRLAVVAVELKCQTASGGSFFARLVGAMEPWEASELQVSIHCATDVFPAEAPAVTEAIRQGIESLDNRPRGSLRISDIAVHPVDFKTREWARVAAAVCRLSCQDLVDRSDTDVQQIAAEICGRPT